MAAKYAKEERMVFTAETLSSQSSEYFVMKNSLLRVLRASAVNYPFRFRLLPTTCHQAFLSMKFITS